jgi:opacity protein-like surface antigen
VSCVSFVVLLSAGPLQVQAQSALDRVYAKLALGPEWTQQTEVKDLFGPAAPGSTVKFDLGSRTTTTIGYKVNDWSSVELDFGGMQNSIHEITGATVHNSTLSAIPVLVNGKLRWSNSTRFTPYIGAGLGASVMLLYADHLKFEDSRADGVASDFVFSYQALGGLRYALNRKLGLSLEYRYTGMDSADFRLPDVVSSGGRTGDRLRLGRLDSHSVSLALDANF